MSCTQKLSSFSQHTGKDLSLLALRLFIAYEFIEAGLEKWNGENWFEHIQENFPFPFNFFSADFNWVMAMGAELLFPVLLVIGLLGRLSALGLAAVTAVAWYAVHSGNGYNVCDNGYKMAFIYLIMLLPLIFQGMGRLSLDHVIAQRFRKQTDA